MTVPAHIEAKARLAHEEDVMDRIAPLWEALPPNLQQRYIRIAIAVHNATMREAVEVARSVQADWIAKSNKEGAQITEALCIAFAGGASEIATALKACIQETGI